MPPANLLGASQQPSRPSGGGPVDFVRDRGSQIAPALRTPEVDSLRQNPPPPEPVHVAISPVSDGPHSPASAPKIIGAIPQRPLSVPPSAPSPAVSDALRVPRVDVPEPTVQELIAAAEADIRRVVAERERLEKHVAELLRERKNIEDGVVPLQAELERITTRLSDIERSEHAASDPKTRRANEQDRWKVVEERYRAEMALVEERQKLEGVIASISDDERRFIDLEKEEALLHKRIETLESETKRRELARKLEEATKAHSTIANQLEKLSSERQRAQALLSELGRKEAGYESRSGKLGELEEKARSAEELRRLATERYQLEKERHETETLRWKAEDDIELLEAQYQIVAQQLAEAEARKVEIERKLRELSS